MEEALILLFALAAASVVERAGKWTGLVFFSIATMILAIVVARPIQGAAVTVSDEEWAETVLWYHKHGLDHTQTTQIRREPNPAIARPSCRVHTLFPVKRIRHRIYEYTHTGTTPTQPCSCQTVMPHGNRGYRHNNVAQFPIRLRQRATTKMDPTSYNRWPGSTTFALFGPGYTPSHATLCSAVADLWRRAQDQDQIIKALLKRLEVLEAAVARASTPATPLIEAEYEVVDKS